MASMRGLFAKQRKICYIPSLGILKCHSSFVILCSWSSSLFGLVSLYAHICLITYTPFVSGNMGESHGRPRKVLIELRLIHRSPVSEERGFWICCLVLTERTPPARQSWSWEARWPGRDCSSLSVLLLREQRELLLLASPGPERPGGQAETALACQSCSWENRENSSSSSVLVLRGQVARQRLLRLVSLTLCVPFASS